MPIRKRSDQRAGPIPEIQVDRENVTFHLDIAGVDRNLRLTIRCDADGEVWLSLTPKHTRSV